MKNERIHLKKKKKKPARIKTTSVKSFKRVYQSMRKELKVRDVNERERERIKKKN